METDLIHKILLTDEKQLEKRTLGLERSYLVTKGNDLIQKTKLSLTLQEQKIIMYLISKIKPTDNELLTQTIDIKDFCKVCGIDYKNGGNTGYIKNTLKHLRDKSCWIQIGKEEKLFYWIQDISIFKDEGIVTVKLNDFLKPYLLNLKEKFTSIALVYSLVMKSQYSIRIYEILKSYEYTKKSIKFNLEDFKKAIGAEKYERFADFRRYILEKSLNEINLLSDLNINYSLEYKAKKVVSIIYFIGVKIDLDERIRVWQSHEKILNK